MNGYDVVGICSEAIDPKFCVMILESTPLIKKSDVPGLGKFLVGYAQHNISNAINQLQSVVQNMTDLYSKKIFLSHASKISKELLYIAVTQSKLYQLKINPIFKVFIS